jgi:transposase
MNIVPPDFGPDIDEFRWAKGRAILSVPHAVAQVRTDLFLVKSQSGPGSYQVRLAPGRIECECADFVDRHLPCKHAAAVRLYLEKWRGAHPMPTHDLSPGPDKAPRGSYPQAWAAYDHAQMEEVRLFDILLSDLLRDVDEPEQAFGRPRVPLRDGLFCAIQKVYSQLSCRRSNSLMGFAAERGHVERNHGYVLSSRVLSREDVTPVLRELITRSAVPLAAVDTGFAQDSTGFQTTTFGAWREDKHNEVRPRTWLKAHALVGVKSHAVVRVSVTDKDGSDHNQFEPLIRETVERGIPLKVVYCDKAYSSRPSYNLAEELGFDLYIPFTSNATGRVSNNRAHPRTGKVHHSLLWRKAFLFFQMHRDEFEAKYHQRSNVESVFSAIKRKFGETIRSRTPCAQANEILAKILAYNLTVLIHEIFEHGVVPDFLSDPAAVGLPCVESVEPVSKVGSRDT